MDIELHTTFARIVEYPVTVIIPDGVQAVRWPDGSTRIKVSEPPTPGTLPMDLHITLQEAAQRGIVRVRRFEM